MQRPLDFKRRSDGELIKENGFELDLDEMARRGAMSKEEKFIGKWYGLYDQRQAGNFMARVVLPGGVLSSAQARALAMVAQRHALGLVAFTTREAAQLHWLKLKMLPEVMRELQQAGLSTFHGCGDVARNVTACPWAEVCPHRRLNALVDARRTAVTLTGQRDLDDLPRKFKISFNGCRAGCSLPWMNDVGLMGLSRRAPDGATEGGYQVVIGGGHGWMPYVAQPLFGFVPRRLATAVCRAVALLFKDTGDRWNRANARLKVVLYRLGIARCRALVEAHLDAEGIDRRAIVVDPVPDAGDPWPARPLAVIDPMGSDGAAIQRVRLPGGELTFRQLHRLAELAEIFGDHRLRANLRQNLEIHGVRPDQVEALRFEIEALGLAARDFDGLTDIVSCVGTTYCPLAVTETHDMMHQLGFVQESRFDAIRPRVRINITGCPNSCSPYRVVDIGLRGARIRERQGSVEGYEVRIGGTQRRHGQSLGTYKAADCVRIVRAVLERFADLATGREGLADTVERVGFHPFRDAVAALSIRYDQAPAPQERSRPADGTLRALDAKTLDRDVPCTAACPASTRVPWYIEQIAAGDPDAAYRINQEDNVFPGVLGRVCTRPCEAACRHQWTGTRGPVAICHLKRAATDRKSAPPAPLPPWFEPTGRRVAVIGSGPAGLAASRELRRYGHDVILYEKHPVLGGMMRLCIPHFRLPRDVLDEEIAAVVDSGIEVRTGVAINSARLESLCADHDAVLLAAGAVRSRVLDLPGLPAGLAVGGLQLMGRYCSHEPLELRAPVLVVGGGFTAIDCARVARRVLGLGGGRVALLVRRTRDLMAASHEELDHLVQEDIDLETLVTPGAALATDDRLQSVTLQRMVLDAPGEDGRPQVKPLPGNTYEVACGTLVFAVGQKRTMELLPNGVHMIDQTRTSREGLYVAGDFSSGSLDVINAVASGKHAADVIDARLMGYPRRRQQLDRQTVVSGETGRLRDHDLVEQPPPELLPSSERLLDDEVDRGLSLEAAQTSARRCYLCQFKYEIDQDRCIHCDWCIQASPRECIRRVTRLFSDVDGATTGFVETELPREGTFIWIDSRNCIRCGACYRICPVGAVRVDRAEIQTVCLADPRPTIA
ncbi:MAG: FAD-dependent oxidoreductase [bacterium]